MKRLLSLLCLALISLQILLLGMAIPSFANDASLNAAIPAADIFVVNNIDTNETGTKIVKLHVQKNYYYGNDVTFIIAIHDRDGILKSAAIKRDCGSNYIIGLNEIDVEFDFPADFNPETDTVKAFVWTTL